MNPLCRNIIFWCKSKNERMLLADLFIKNIPEDMCKVHNNRNCVEIIFKDGSVYTFLPFYESARGRRCHESYVYLDDTTTKDDIEFVNRIISPITTRARHSNVYVIDTVEIEKLYRELTMDRKTFEEWYIERVADAYNEAPENSFPIKYEELERILNKKV